MIVAERKELEEIKEMVEPYDRILILGCNTCATIRLYGGEKECEKLSIELGDVFKDKKISYKVVERQCEQEFLEDEAVKKEIEENDCVLSMSCSIGPQTVVEIYPNSIAVPAQNTSFIGRAVEHGIFQERCALCGDCIIDETFGLCPIARCAKSLMNGPCGGSHDGKCEVDPERDCVWQLIYDRASRLGRIDDLLGIIEVKDWSNGMHGTRKEVKHV